MRLPKLADMAFLMFMTHEMIAFGLICFVKGTG